MRKFLNKESVKTIIILTIIFLSIYLVFEYTTKIKNSEKNNYENEKILNENIKTPVILEFGSNYCAYCVDMIPILEQIKIKYKDKIKVELIDIYEKPQKTDEYNIRLIPTQVFLDENNKEIYRNEGILTEKEIIKKLQEMEIK